MINYKKLKCINYITYNVCLYKNRKSYFLFLTQYKDNSFLFDITLFDLKKFLNKEINLNEILKNSTFIYDIPSSLKEGINKKKIIGIDFINKKFNTDVYCINSDFTQSLRNSKKFHMKIRKLKIKNLLK